VGWVWRWIRRREGCVAAVRRKEAGRWWFAPKRR
jgi:hypothetical protein